jgi:hypothetical protein
MKKISGLDRICPKGFAMLGFCENDVESPSVFGILAKMSPRFSEMNKVRVNDRENEPYEGYVIDSQFRDARWIYKLSISEDPSKLETYDNWLPEEWLELTK